MPAHTIDVRRTVPADREEVWALLADVGTWSHWGAFDESELETPGSPEAAGVGAVRRFRTGRRRTRERITDFEPPHRLGYELLDGVPVRDYRAVVTLEAAPGGTEVAWCSRFRAAVPGTGSLVQRKLEGFITQLLADLDRAVAGR